MNNRQSERRHSDDGYTLMELLVVLAILGLLAAIATPMVLRYLDSAKLSTAKTEVSNIEAALDLYKYDAGHYPSSEEGLKVLLAAPADESNWNGPYLKKANTLTDPWGRPYQYRSPGLHGDYDLYSKGPSGSDDDGAAKPKVASW